MFLEIGTLRNNSLKRFLLKGINGNKYFCGKMVGVVATNIRISTRPIINPGNWKKKIHINRKILKNFTV